MALNNELPFNIAQKPMDYLDCSADQGQLD
jgi:hypothetical protein